MDLRQFKPGEVPPVGRRGSIVRADFSSGSVRVTSYDRRTKLFAANATLIVDRPGTLSPETFRARPARCHRDVAAAGNDSAMTALFLFFASGLSRRADEQLGPIRQRQIEEHGGQMIDRKAMADVQRRIAEIETDIAVCARRSAVVSADLLLERAECETYLSRRGTEFVSAADRARSGVTKAIGRALKVIRSVNEALAHHLERRDRTALHLHPRSCRTRDIRALTGHAARVTL